MGGVSIGGVPWVKPGPDDHDIEGVTLGMAIPVVAGIDIGSLSAKAVLMSNNEVIASAIMLTEVDTVKTAFNVMEKALEQCGLQLDDILCAISTGYGRVNVPFAKKNVTEISCHAKGNWWLFRDVRTILDMGGQDCKAIRCDENGRVKNFIMNDKCAAGTGRYLERLANITGITLDEVGSRSLQPVAGAATINSTCTLFAEYEVIKLLRQGVHVNDILAGAVDALAERILPLLNYVEVVPAFAISGGLAKNSGMVKRLEEKLSLTPHIAPEPQVVGALGAAIFANETVQER